ncbi:MAG: biotin synthase [Candidatus Marinamargulisbacteria bacterium]|jgi:biotin synthase
MRPLFFFVDSLRSIIELSGLLYYRYSTVKISEINRLAEEALSGKILDAELCLQIFEKDTPLLPLLQAAYTVRKTYWQDDVTIHILNNAQNGSCAEDCHYCAQAKGSKAKIEPYAMKSEAEIISEAKTAHESGAFRYCMVLSGRGPKQKRIERISDTIKKIKGAYPIEVCLSAGLIDQKGAATLKEAGLDRLNHNLNAAESMYEKICTTHTYQDRMNTLINAKSAGLGVCSGLIVGMGETLEDIIQVALELRKVGAKSIPVNFFIPIPGTKLTIKPNLDPEKCLRILCLFRFLNPEAEVRAAAGRELHLRHLQSLCFYPANSVFMDGYLNTQGTKMSETLEMIQDAGFKIRSEYDISELLKKVKNPPTSAVKLKDIKDLRPTVA